MIGDAPQSRPWRDAAIGALVGLAAYFALGFNHVLPAHKLDWLFSPTDQNPYYGPATYYLGWNWLFRHTPWSWPIGTNRDYGMEFGASIVYSRFNSSNASISYTSRFHRGSCRIFSMWGFGFWVCYLLQGMFAMLIASRLRGHRLLPKILICNFFRQWCRPFCSGERSKSQYAPSGIGWILWAIYLYLRERRRRIRWVWLAIGSFDGDDEFTACCQ